MFIRKAAFPALALAVVLAGAGGLATVTAPNADAQATAAPPPGQARPEHHFDPARHIEGRIAFLKAELKITDAQAAAFARVADAMRENVKDMAQIHEQFRANRDKPKTAVEHLEARVKMGEMHTQHEQRFLAAFKPLYDSLSDDQKKAADELLAGHHHHPHR
ncbi:MAG TPA: Spy/CpxP family protein refolding chaperone [Stellaceae bacterium]|nr:Spy/CpxP family protein refolding chaperone [Stellaceae bacterium]